MKRTAKEVLRTLENLDQLDVNLNGQTMSNAEAVAIFQADENEETPIPQEVISAAAAKDIPLGAWTRLKIGDDISDWVAQASSTGLYFWLCPGIVAPMKAGSTPMGFIPLREIYG